jgi:hypothetical protein
MNFKLMLIATVITFLIGCTSDKSPNQFYLEYKSKVNDGINYDEEKVYYSKRKLQEVEFKFPRYIEQMKKSREEVIGFYLKFSREVAKCKEITLISETINGDKSIIEYSQKDICGNESNSLEKQVVRMVKESGWKLDSVEVSL